MQRQIGSLTFILMFILFVAACSNSTKEIKVTDISNNTTLVISELKDILTIEKAIRNAKKVDGIVDVTTPQYSIQIEKENYLFWLHNQSATFINKQNSETLFQIENADKIIKITCGTR